MKQWKVRLSIYGRPTIETIVTARNSIDAKRIAAAMLSCKESEVQVSEIR